LSEWMLTALKTKEELLNKAVLYLRIYYLGMPALAIYNFGNAVYSAVGNTKKPLYYLGFSGVLNIILNLFFVIVCRMDVAGVALASIISQYVSAVLILQALLRSKDIYALHPGKLRMDRELTRDILKLGMPSGLQNVIFQFANSFVQMGVNSFDAIMVAGNSAASNADALVYDVMAAFYTACGSFMGQNYGAGKRKRVRNSYLVSLAYSFGIGTIGGIALVIFGRQFLGLFTNDPAVVDAGMKRLTIMGFSYGFSAFMDSAIAASRALGKSVIPTVIVIIGSCIFRMVWVNTVFAYFKTIPSLYLLYIFSWGITAVVEIIYWVHVYRNTKIG
jgi:putative MATE family efflux protein